MMYRPKTVFTGYRIGLKNSDLYIAIPDKYWKKNKAEVEFGDRVRTYHRENVVTERTFPDKFYPDRDYTLRYVLWRRRRHEKA